MKISFPKKSKEATSSKASLVEAAKSFESISELRDAQIKRWAFIVAGISIFVAICCVIALIIVLPLKSVEYRVIAVDTRVGRGEELTALKEKQITEEEAVSRFYTAMYVRLREQYNYPTLQNDYDTVQIYNSAAVNAVYLSLYNGNKSPDILFNRGENVALVEIISNSLTYGTDPDHMALVRFKRTVRNLRTNLAYDKYYIARISFRFDLNRKMSEAEREVNPLGFTVTSYQLDEELR